MRNFLYNLFNRIYLWMFVQDLTDQRHSRESGYCCYGCFCTEDGRLTYSYSDELTYLFGIKLWDNLVLEAIDCCGTKRFLLYYRRFA